MATHSSGLAWRIPMDRGAWGATVHGVEKSRTKLSIFHFSSILSLCCSVTKSFLTLCDPVDCSTPVSSILYYLLGFSQTHVHCIGDAIQPSHPLPSPSPPAFNFPQHQGLFLPKSLFFTLGSQNIGDSASASVLPMNIQGTFPFRIDWFDLLLSDTYFNEFNCYKNLLW